MRINNVAFIAGADKYESLPTSTLPEVAFAGRSNVGKSSLINNLVSRKNLAHTSASPGKTRQINLYNIENLWVLADFPGYGYAAVSKKERERWAELSKYYFLNRPHFSFVCLLIDSRHDPQNSDLAMLEWLENNGVKYLVVLTKCDKISQEKITARKKQLDDYLQFCKNNIEVLPYSSVSSLGRKELLAIIKKNIVNEEIQ